MMWDSSLTAETDAEYEKFAIQSFYITYKNTQGQQTTFFKYNSG
jgi:hypothetical protein